MLLNNWFICQLCVHRDMKHLGSLESTQEARVALSFFSFVLLGKDFIIIPFTFQAVTKGARNKILLSIKKLSERPETLNRLEKVKI